MNNNKHLRPNLVDPLIGQKIMKTLKPPPEDYWAPTKNGLTRFYENFVRPNTILIIFIVIILILLYYRYRTIKKEKEKKEIEKFYSEDSEDTNNQESIVKKDESCKIKSQKQPISKKEMDEYTKVLLQLYAQQKERMREPHIKKFNERTNPAPIDGPKFAYPMYPYGKGGYLIPSGATS